MILSMTFQCRLFLLAVAMGIAGGFVYTFIISAVLLTGKRMLKQICDVLFWLMYALGVFLVMLPVNCGEIRPFSILGIFVGFIIFHGIFGEYVLKITNIVYKACLRIISVLTEIVLTPINILLFPVKKIIFYLKKACKNVKNMRK